MASQTLKDAVQRVTPTLDEALDMVTVHESSDVNFALMEAGEAFAPYPDDHWLVSDDRHEGIHAQFTTEADACAWRMFLVAELVRNGREPI